MKSGINGREQIKAGLALINWSGLAVWSVRDGCLRATDFNEFEKLAQERHDQFGRVLSWVIFSVGCEYVVKGACLVRKLISPKNKDVLRPPKWDEDLQTWSNAIIKRDSSVLEPVSTTNTLGQLPLAKLLDDLPEGKKHRAAFQLLRDSMRNRDAHQYVRNVRAAHFHAVPRLFVPALNAVIQSVSQLGS